MVKDMLQKQEYGHVTASIIPEHYIQVWNNEHRVIDETGRIVLRKPINFAFYSGMKNIDGQKIIYSPCIYTTQQCNGRTYVLGIGWLYEVTPIDIIKVAKIPDFNPSSIHGRIFVHNDIIYVSNGSTVYQFDDETNQLVEEVQLIGQYFYCWAGITVQQFKTKLVVLIPGSFVQKELCTLDEDQTFVSYCGAGVIIMHNQAMDKFTVVELLSGRKVILNNAGLDQQNIMNNLVFGRSGLSLPDEQLESYFGSQFLCMRDQFYYKFVRNLQANKNYPSLEVNYVINKITQANLQKQLTQHVETRVSDAENRIVRKVYESIRTIFNKQKKYTIIHNE